jgi:hypothetical protein
MPNDKNPSESYRPSSDVTLEYAKIIREMLWHEDEVIDQRFTWLCQIQGFLFAALAFAWKEPTANYLVLLLCLLGISVAITTWSSLRAVSLGVTRMLNWWDMNKLADYSGPDVYARRLPWLEQQEIRDWRRQAMHDSRQQIIHGWQQQSIYALQQGPLALTKNKFLRPWFVLPLIFGLAWIMVLIIRFWT